MPDQDEQVTILSKKKKGKLLVCILISIIIILTGLVIYFAFIKDGNKGNSKEDNKSSEKKDNKVDNKDNDPNKDDNTKKDDNDKSSRNESEVISKIMKKIEKYYLLELTYGKTTNFTKDNITDIQLNNLETNMVAKYEDSWSDHFENEEEWSFSKSEADTFFKEVYGFVPTSYRDVICDNDGEALLIYKNNKFVWNDEHPGHGAYAVNYLDYSVLDVKEEGNTYTLDILFIYGNEEMGFYINKNEVSAEEAYDDDDYEAAQSRIYKNYFNKHKNEYKNDGYKFTFEKINGEYYLKSITL